jgi:hypothetical protein
MGVSNDAPCPPFTSHGASIRQLFDAAQREARASAHGGLITEQRVMLSGVATEAVITEQLPPPPPPAQGSRHQPTTGSARDTAGVRGRFHR